MVQYICFLYLFILSIDSVFLYFQEWRLGGGGWWSVGNLVTRGHIGNVLYIYSLFIVNFPSLCVLCYLIFIISFADGKSDREREKEQGMNKTLSGIYFYLLLLPVWKLLLILMTII